LESQEPTLSCFGKKSIQPLGSMLNNVSELHLSGKLQSKEDIQSLYEKRNPPIVKGCFIATAAMGSALHPHVQLLRDFRDNILLQSRYKEAFENLLNKYYLLSPPIAKKMDESIFLKFFLRYLLVYPIIFGIKGLLPVIDVILGIKRDAGRRKNKINQSWP
jgi:hypothetical protein